MSVAQKSTEIERHEAHLSEVDGEPPYTVHGIAIGEGDVTRGSSGIEKKWPREALKPAAETLSGRPLVVDHDNDSHSVVGKVTEAIYKEETGVLYEAELFDEELAEKIANGLLEVSIRGFHSDVSQMEESEEGAKVVEDLRFDNLSIVPVGAAPSNSVEIGPSEELTAAECAEIVTNLPEETSEEDDEELGNNVPEGAEEIRSGTKRKYNNDVFRYPEGENTPPEDSEGMSEDEKSDELASFGLHAPEYEGTTKDASGDGRVRKQDFGTDDLGEIAEHFLLSDTGFPPDKFGDLKLPVVTPDGDLSLTKLRAAKRAVGQVEGLDSSLAVDVVMMVNRLIMSEFPNEPLAANLEEGDIMEKEELAGTAIHEPEFSDTTKGSWDKPALEDFTDNSWDDLSSEMKQEISDHYIVSKSGNFPPEDFGDLALPVVEPNGNLNLSALQNAKARAGQVEGVSTSDEEEINNIINRLANDNFDVSFEEDEESEDAAEHPIDVVRSTRTAFEFADGRIVSIADGEVEELSPAVEQVSEEQTESTETEEMSSNDDAQEEEAEAEAGEGSTPDPSASTETEQGDTMTDDNTVEIEEDDLEELRQKAEKAEERESELEELREGFSEDLAELKDRTAVLEDADRELVEELTDKQDPVVVESEQFEELEQHVDEARGAYAAALNEYTGPAVSEEDLKERYTIDELRERLEEQLDEEDEVEEELTPDPKSEDPEEEELEEVSGGTEEEEELSDDIKQKQEELRAKIGSN